MVFSVCTLCCHSFPVSSIPDDLWYVESAIHGYFFSIDVIFYCSSIYIYESTNIHKIWRNLHGMYVWCVYCAVINSFAISSLPDNLCCVDSQVRSQLLTYEHEGNWNKAVETYDLLLRSRKSPLLNPRAGALVPGSSSADEQNWQSHKGLMRSLRQMGCTYVVDLCNQSLAQHRDLECDPEFRELQYEAAWQSCNWDNNLFGPDFVDDSLNNQGGLGFHAHIHRWNSI